MSSTTVAEFANELKKSTDTLLEQLKSAGVPKASAGDVLTDADDVAVIETTPVPRIRHTVYTARYRLVQKGPERGKWEADVVAEAEAPLITVQVINSGAPMSGCGEPGVPPIAPAIANAYARATGTVGVWSLASSSGRMNGTSAPMARLRRSRTRARRRWPRSSNSATACRPAKPVAPVMAMV